MFECFKSISLLFPPQRSLSPRSLTPLPSPEVRPSPFNTSSCNITTNQKHEPCVPLQKENLSPGGSSPGSSTQTSRTHNTHTPHIPNTPTTTHTPNTPNTPNTPHTPQPHSSWSKSSKHHFHRPGNTFYFISASSRILVRTRMILDGI